MEKVQHEVPEERTEKRRIDHETEDNDPSPPKILTTPRRSRGCRNTQTPNSSKIPVPQSSVKGFVKTNAVKDITEEMVCDVAHAKEPIQETTQGAQESSQDVPEVERISPEEKINLKTECYSVTDDKSPLQLEKEPSASQEDISDKLPLDERKELQKEIEKVKKRRSTSGRGRKSLTSQGGRRSLCPAMPLLSLEDQIHNIPQKLPQASKVSHLLDLTLRVSLRRLEEKLNGDSYVSELRLDLLTKSEELASAISYKIAGQPLVVDGPAPAPSSEDHNQGRISALKGKTKELEQEYKNWKVLLKERKLACKAAETEFREAKSGESRIVEDVQAKQLTTVQQSILTSGPNYHQYIKDVQIAREKTVLMLQEVKHTAGVMQSYSIASTAQAESCYSLVEEMSFGFLKTKPWKKMVNSLLRITPDNELIAVEP